MLRTIPLWLLVQASAGTPSRDARPLTIVAPAAPGGGWDQLARVMQRVLEQEGLSSRVQVDNIPGAAGTVGLARFVSGRRGDADALLVTGLVMVGGVVQARTAVDLVDATPLARLVGEWEVVAVPSASPWRSLGDLVEAWRKAPGSVVFGGGSAGGTDQILVELLARAAGIDRRAVQYVAFSGGGEARGALLGSQVSAGVSGVGEFAELAAAGQVRLLAVSADRRIEGLDVPTIVESGWDVVLANWRGVLAPPGLSLKARADLEVRLEAMVRSEAWRTELKARGWQDSWMGADAFGRFVRSERLRVQAVMVDGGEGVTGSRGLWRSGILFTLLAAFGMLSWPAAQRRTAGSAGRWWAAGLIVAGLALQALLMRVIGFVPLAAVTFLLTARALGERRMLRTIGISLVVALLVFVVFGQVLDVPLPSGVFSR